MKSLAILFAGLGLSCFLYSKSLEDEGSPSSKNKKAEKSIPSFTLKDTQGNPCSLSDFKDKKAVVLIFLGTECPINNAYLPRLIELSRSYADLGVQFLGINANCQDSVDRVARHAKKHKISFPVLKDRDAKIADLLGAQRTPEAVVLDDKRTIRYQGRIDDQYGIGFQRPRPTRSDLKMALDEILAGKEISVANTKVMGCLIARPARPKGEGPITYAREVSRIVQENCQECHRPGQIGPMALTTFHEVADWSATIREVILDPRMPPWHADPKYGTFSNNRSLSQKDRDILLRWVDDGCPKGDDKDLPPVRQFAEGWRIGKPDVVFEMKTEFTVPAKAPKGGVPYQYFFVPTGFKEEVWVQAAEAKPGNRAVVHHIIVYVIDPKTRRRPGEGGIGNGFLVPYAPGDMPAVFPPGTAKKIPKGHALLFQMHYTPNGTEQTDRSSVGLIFAKEPPRNEARTRAIVNHRLVIPQGDANYQVVSSSTFKEDAQLLGLLPHMHLRGKDFEFRVLFPDGKSETLLSVPRYDFNWQTTYRLDKPLIMPKGTRIECTAHFDNSADNPNNPDPTKEVRWGEQTWEEMMIGFADYVLIPKAGP